MYANEVEQDLLHDDESFDDVFAEFDDEPLGAASVAQAPPLHSHPRTAATLAVRNFSCTFGGAPRQNSSTSEDWGYSRLGAQLVWHHEAIVESNLSEKCPGTGPPLELRSEVNSELNFCPNFEGLVLGCIDADFCK